MSTDIDRLYATYRAAELVAADARDQGGNAAAHGPERRAHRAYVAWKRATDAQARKTGEDAVTIRGRFLAAREPGR